MRIKELHWDDANIEHIARHGVSLVEVEDVCFSEHISFRGRQKRYIVYGKTERGRMIMIVLERLFGQVFRPITAREMSEREKQIYRKRMRE